MRELEPSMKTVLLSAPYIMASLDRFMPVFKHYDINTIVADVKERLEESDLMKYAGQFDGVICGDDRFTEQVMSACLPRLKVISKWGTGIDSIDLEAAKRLDIQVCNTPNAFTLPVADTVLGYILTFARNIPWMDTSIKHGGWEKLSGKSLAELTLGVVGVGNIGKAVLKRAHGFGMQLLGNDIVSIDPGFINQYHVRMLSLPELLAQADYVSLNCSLNPTSHHLINEVTLGMMKSGAVLINTSRGPVVDEPALIYALQAGCLHGAALDVFEEEPLPVNSPLKQMEYVLLGSHNSNSSPMAWEHVHWNTIRNLLEGLGVACDDLERFKNQGINGGSI
jgi:D-3-phosphoglycerate dehydrogenase / 2-oxoglutarate reductase